MCGEKTLRSFSSRSHAGSPPRVRGKAARAAVNWVIVRITPACAGKRLWIQLSPHVAQGSPPRVRGKVEGYDRLVRDLGITPACAGKRYVALYMQYQTRDHPRVCGEKTKKIPFNAPKTAFSSVLCQISFNFSYSMSVNVQSARARCVSLISIPKCRHNSCNV